MTGDGLEAVWSQLRHHRNEMERSGRLERRRADQRVAWMWATVEEQLVSAFRRRADVRDRVGDLERQLRDGEITPTLAARQLLD
jgi:LAO/AO transport system kinase